MTTEPPDYFGMQPVLEGIRNSNDVREVVEHLAQYASRFGFTTVGLGHVVNPLMQFAPERGVFRFSNWKKEWVDEWAGKNLIIQDPIARYSLLCRRPFCWKDAFTDARTRDKKIEHLIHEFGFSNGISLPIHSGDSPPGIVSLGSDRLDHSEAEIQSLFLVGTDAYVHIEQLMGLFPFQTPAELTSRESEVLHYVAAGKTNKDIGVILRISEFSVRDHIESACKKLGALGRAHAVALALRQRLILP